MPYAHAEHGARCARCNDYAHRLVGTQPLCVDHFANLIDHCLHSVRRRILAPSDITPDGLAVWAELLRHGITIGVVAPDEVREAWNTVREFAA